jgi:tetratricopeptide (TPR) repeat protein
LKKGRHYFELALLEDPHYALAYTGLADTYNLLGFYGFMSPLEAVPKATAAAVKALEIDESLAEAHASLAFASLFLDWDWFTAEKEFQCALELNPNYIPAHYWYAVYLVIMGREQEAIAEARRAQELDPLSVNAHWYAGMVYYFLHQYDPAIKNLQKALDVDPGFSLGHLFLGRALDLKGMAEEAFGAWQKCATLSGLSKETVEAFDLAYRSSGMMGYVRSWLNVLLDRRQQSYERPHTIALMYVRLGEHEKAFEWLFKAYAERDAEIYDIKVNPYFDPLHADPRFTDLLKKVGFEN